ncbi:MAG: HAD family phosphatase [Endomicrobium sp.]|nr:HAD family phosphatase [Endomicrobium sp.]
MAIKIVIFDLGNVIFKFDLLKFVKAYVKKIPNHKITDFNNLIPSYSDVSHAYEKGNISSFEFYDTVARKTKYVGTYNEFAVQWNNIFEPMPEMIELIAALSQNYRLVALSNTNELHFDYLKERYPEVFALFNRLFLSYKMHSRKPEDEIFLKTIQCCNVLPSEIFYVDDLEDNVTVARNNGISSHLFTNSTVLIKELKDKKMLMQQYKGG